MEHPLKYRTYTSLHVIKEVVWLFFAVYNMYTNMPTNTGMVLFRHPLSADYPQVSSLVSRNPQLLVLLRGVSMPLPIHLLGLDYRL